MISRQLTKFNGMSTNQKLLYIENEQATILWNMTIHTDSEIGVNKSDIIIRDHTNQKCQIIDMAVPLD